MGLLYGMVGTLNMADIAQKLNSVEDPGMVTVVSLMFMVSFGIKAAAFPCFSGSLPPITRRKSPSQRCLQGS